MRVPAKFGFAAAAILASTLGFASLTHAAPLAGAADHGHCGPEDPKGCREQMA